MNRNRCPIVIGIVFFPRNSHIHIHIHIHTHEPRPRFWMTFNSLQKNKWSSTILLLIQVMQRIQLGRMMMRQLWFFLCFCFICLALGVLIFTRSVLSALYLSKSATCTASWTFMHDVVRMVCKGKRNKCHGMANESIRYIMIYIFGIPIPEPEIVTDCHWFQSGTFARTSIDIAMLVVFITWRNGRHLESTRPPG